MQRQQKALTLTAKVIIGHTTHMHGHTAGNAMGVNTWAAFVGSDAQEDGQS